MVVDTRLEEDALGVVEVPADALWGAQTQRALTHFQISDERMPGPVLLALARLKRICARVNAELGRLDQPIAAAIVKASDEILAGAHPDAFPLSVWQSGSGTQTNMNLNEVIANRASELLGGCRGKGRLVHPNDHVNLGQSTNDVFPTAMHMAAVYEVEERLLPVLRVLKTTLSGKSTAYQEIIKIGRTHLQDATPLTLGEEMSGWVAQLVFADQTISTGTGPLFELAIGGTAVGNGVNTHPEFGMRVAAMVAAESRKPFRCAANRFAAMAAHDAMVSAHASLRTLAVALNKIANDLRLLASGPRGGLGELTLPSNEPGSSIMPGKVNPSQCEALAMVCCQIIGNDVAIGIAGAAGTLELNVYKPLIVTTFLRSAGLLTDAMSSFERYCARGIEPNRARIEELVSQSLMLATALSYHIGYDLAAKIVHYAHEHAVSLRDAAVAIGHVSDHDFDTWVRSDEIV